MSSPRRRVRRRRATSQVSGERELVRIYRSISSPRRAVLLELARLLTRLFPLLALLVDAP